MGDFSKKVRCGALFGAAMAGNPVALKGLMAQGVDDDTCRTIYGQQIKERQRTYWVRQGGGRLTIEIPESATHRMNLLNYAVLGAASNWKKEDPEPRMKTIALLSSLGINKTSGNSKWTPLHVASQICQPELILLLLSMGADPMIKSGDGKTGPEMVPEWCEEGSEAYRFYYFNAPEKPKKKQ